MRKLVLLRGIQGSGKSTFISNNQLSPYTLSSDALRLMIRSPSLGGDGKLSISGAVNSATWKMLFELLEARMKRGEFVVVDATHVDTSSIGRYKELVNRYYYDLYIVDFSDADLDECLERNKSRAEHSVVPDHVVKKFYDKLISSHVPSYAKVIKPSEFSAVMSWSTKDFSGWKKIHHIGDLQGCKSVLSKYLGDGFADDELYIFVGDIVDRGIENAEILSFMCEAARRDNVIVVRGNHEYHLERWVHGEESVSNEFKYKTLPQILKGGISKDDVGSFCASLVDVVDYNYKGKRVIVTHAGLGCAPKNMTLIASEEMIKGVGGYADPIHDWFMSNTDENVYQVHGHRNVDEIAIRPRERSFNLEGKVEFGGELRVVTLDASGFECIEVANPVYAFRNSRNHNSYPCVPSWSGAAVDHEKSVLLMNEMRRSSDVKESVFGHISSFSFSRKVFYKKSWDDFNVKARGLFVNNLSGEIVARSYDKFFNVSEREETSLQSLKGSLKFPVCAFVKENGFLGILGYDAYSDSLFSASKSTPNSDFAGWFREILDKTIPSSKLSKLKRFLRDTNSSMVFEVNDPINDPHIIEYGDRHVVLLDVVRRSADFEKMPYDDVKKIANEFGFACKSMSCKFEAWEQFSSWYNSMTSQVKTCSGRHIEGFVIEDSGGFMTKVKLPYYSFWKSMRSVKDHILKSRVTGNPPKLRIESAAAAEFCRWASNLPDDVISSDIITLRKMCLADIPHISELILTDANNVDKTRRREEVSGLDT